MTIAFWVLVANLIIIALLIITIPIWFRRNVNLDDNQQHNLAIGRQKLIALKNKLNKQELSKLEYEAQLTELELTLDSELKPTNSKAKSSQGRWVVALIVPLLPISTIAIYLAVGQPQMLSIPISVAPKQTTTVTKPKPNIAAMITILVQRIQQQPENTKAWLILGRAYMITQDFTNAATAFAQANQLQANDVDILIQYADALAMSRSGRMAGKPSELIFAALEIQPKNITGLWLAGMAKDEQGDFQAALSYWHKLKPLVANDLQITARLQKLIVSTQIKANQTQTFKPEKSTTTKLTVYVELAADLIKQVASTDTLFIYAQALQGSRVPLAIVRKQARDLPITVTLSDAQAMSPTATLSNNKQVKILARISKTGDAMPQTGDLLGTTNPIQISEIKTIKLVISKVIK